MRATDPAEPAAVLARPESARVVPVTASDDGDRAELAARALVAGGFRCLLRAGSFDEVERRARETAALVA